MDYRRMLLAHMAAANIEDAEERRKYLRDVGKLSHDEIKELKQFGFDDYRLTELEKIRDEPIEAMLKWYIVLTLAAAEYGVHDILQKKGIETYYPYYHAGRRTGRWPLGILRPQFPGYLFAGLADGQTISLIEETPGSRGVLRLENEIVRISPSQIVKIKADCHRRWREGQLQSKRIVSYLVGEVVPAPSGPFEGKPCLIEAIDEKAGKVYASIGPFKTDFSLPSSEPTPRAVHGSRNAARFSSEVQPIKPFVTNAKTS